MKWALIFLSLLFITPAFAEQDRTTVQVQFRKAYWVCLFCGQEDFQDLHMDGGDLYEHNCSRCEKWFNSFKEYNGALRYSAEEYSKIDSKVIDDAKQDLVDKWVYDIKNPPPIVEVPPPTKEELEAQKAELQTKIDELQSKIDVLTVEDVKIIK